MNMEVSRQPSIIKHILRLGHDGKGKFDAGALWCVGTLADDWGITQAEIMGWSAEIVETSKEQTS
jgi:hypothetical protein